MEFCKQFNARTQEKQGILAGIDYRYTDKSFEFVKTPPAAVMLMEASKQKRIF
jgi:large subunit ribosomal protein L11